MRATSAVNWRVGVGGGGSAPSCIPTPLVSAPALGMEPPSTSGLCTMEAALAGVAAAPAALASRGVAAPPRVTQSCGEGPQLTFHVKVAGEILPSPEVTDPERALEPRCMLEATAASSAARWNPAEAGVPASAPPPGCPGVPPAGVARAVGVAAPGIQATMAPHCPAAAGVGMWVWEGAAGTARRSCVAWEVEPWDAGVAEEAACCPGIAESEVVPAAWHAGEGG